MPRAASPLAPGPATTPAVLQELRAFRWNGRTTKKAVTSVGHAKERPIVVETLRKSLRIPSRYRTFLLEADPLKVALPML